MDLKRKALGAQGTWKCPSAQKYRLENESDLRGSGSLEQNCQRLQRVMDTGVTHRRIAAVSSSEGGVSAEQLSGFRRTQKVVGGFSQLGVAPPKPL